MATTEQDHVKPAASGQLVGQGPMTEEAKAAFLQQARTDEKAYAASMAAKDPQHYMYNPIPVKDAGGYSYADHPLNQKIAAETKHIDDLRYLLNNGKSFSELADLRELAKKTTSLMNDQATLDGYYGVAEKHAAVKTRIETTQVSAAATSTAVPAAKTPATELPRGAAINLPPDMVDMMDENELKAYHANLDNHVDHIKQKHGSKVVATLGLLAASAEAVYATPGPMTTKLDAAGKALKDQVVGAIPFSGPAQQVSHGEFKAASGNAAKEAVGYIPVVATIDTAASIFSKEGLTNSAVMVTEGLRSKAAQAVIDAQPTDKTQLSQMQHDKTQAPINRHLAEYQLRFMDAVAKNDSAGTYTASSRLTELAERKLVLLAEWKQSADHFITALKDPHTDWAKLAKNSDVAPQAAIHLAAINSGYPAAFVEKMDATLAKNLATGTPVSPEMMAITKSVQVSAAQPQVNTAHQEMVMAH